MRLFHDEDDGPVEPVHGLPERLPEGEKVLWQGRPSAMALAFNAFRLRWVIGYFLVLTVFRLANLSSTSGTADQMTSVVTSSLGFGVVSVLLILGLSYAMSRAAVFTITSERVVMRFGAAIRKYVNVPYSKMTGAQLKRKGLRVGDISMQLEGKEPAYLHLWPFVRPFKYSKPQPMMRGIKDPEEVAQILARAVFEQAPDKVRMELASSAKETASDLSPNSSVPAT